MSAEGAEMRRSRRTVVCQRARLIVAGAILMQVVLLCCYDGDSGVGGGIPAVDRGDQDLHPRAPGPSEEEVIGFALHHVERLGLWPGARKQAEFAEDCRAFVERDSLIDPSGAWMVNLSSPKHKNRAVLWVVVSSHGRLLSFLNFWPAIADDEASDGDDGMTPREALERATAVVKAIRGSFPDDLVVTMNEAVQEGDVGDYIGPVDWPRPYWISRWCQRDGEIVYPKSWIEVRISKEHGTLLYKDQYIGRKTRHTPKLGPQDALAIATRYVETEVLPRHDQVLEWNVGCSQNAEAYVWEVPGSQGDSLVYTCPWVVVTKSKDGREHTDVGWQYIDAETGQFTFVDMSPASDWVSQPTDDENGK